MSMSICLAHNMLKKGDLPEPLWSGSMLQYSIQRSCDVTTMCILGLYITVEAGWLQHRSVPQDLKEEKQSMLLGINMLNTHLLKQEIGAYWRKKCSYLCRSTERNTISCNSHISMRNKWLRNYRGGGEESKRDYKYNSHTVFWKHLFLFALFPWNGWNHVLIPPPVPKALTVFAKHLSTAVPQDSAVSLLFSLALCKVKS